MRRSARRTSEVRFQTFDRFCFGHIRVIRFSSMSMMQAAGEQQGHCEPRIAVVRQICTLVGYWAAEAMLRFLHLLCSLASDAI